MEFAPSGLAPTGHAPESGGPKEALQQLLAGVWRAGLSVFVFETRS
jgi:hypothetical protein